MCFGANMAGRLNKNAFKCFLLFLILSQKQILGVKNVVWGVSTDPRISFLPILLNLRRVLHIPFAYEYRVVSGLPGVFYSLSFLGAATISFFRYRWAE